MRVFAVPIRVRESASELPDLGRSARVSGARVHRRRLLKSVALRKGLWTREGSVGLVCVSPQRFPFFVQELRNRLTDHYPLTVVSGLVRAGDASRSAAIPVGAYGPLTGDDPKSDATCPGA